MQSNHCPRMPNNSIDAQVGQERRKKMTKAEIINAVLYGITACGTLALAGLAIWGERIKSWLVGPKLRLVLQKPKPSVLFQQHGGVKFHYYSLTVQNERPTAVAMNCRVYLKKLWRRVPNGEFGEVDLAYPLLMCWPPSEYTPPSMTVRNDHPVDFGMLEENKFFRPISRWVPVGFDANYLRSGETMRFGFEIVSDDFVSARLQVFEVSWNGFWSDSSDEMTNNLQMREIEQ
jgi:hypothetical protein